LRSHRVKNRQPDDGRKRRNDLVRRRRNILAALIAAAGMGGVTGPLGCRVHQPGGDRAGTRSAAYLQE
jgi:hypothetical protein